MPRTRTYVVSAICVCIAAGVVAAISLPARPPQTRGAGFFFRDGFSGYLSYAGPRIRHVIVFDRRMDIGVGETLRSSEHGFTYHSVRSGQSIEVVDVGKHELRICGQTYDLRDGWLLGCKVRDGTCEVFRIEEKFGREIPVAVYEKDQIEAYLCGRLEAIARTDGRLLGMKIDPRAAAKGPESE